MAGTHSVIVSKLATTSSSYSGYISSGTSLGGQQIVVDYGADSSNPLSTDTINIPNNSTGGIPITLSNGAGVTSVTVTLQYNPNLLTISGATVNAALSVAGPAVRMSVMRLRQLAPLVQQAGLRISRELGYQAARNGEANAIAAKVGSSAGPPGRMAI